MRPIATTTRDFADLRRKGCIYVDKTANFHRLASSMSMRMCFLARPRRFGKPIWLAGLSFDSETRQLVDCAAERYSHQRGTDRKGYKT